MKTLIICCDGTWNTADQQHNGQWVPSNITLMSKAIVSNKEQLIYYDSGLGTHGWFDKFSGGVFGLGLFKKIQQAYCYLVKNYQPGDKLVFLGFSRGAYTVRSLAGLITEVGILTTENISQHQRAFDFYRKASNDKNKRLAFSQKFCHPSKEVYFIGVWDTIGSLGIPLSSFNWLTHWYFKFHNTQLSAHVVHAYHALAIDEQRRSFKPVLWNETQENSTQRKPSQTYTLQTIEQCWFVGAHSNVGGGYTDSGLSDLSFNWIKNKLSMALPELVFNKKFISEHIKADYKAKIANSLSWFFPISRMLPIQRKPLQNNAINEIIAPSVKKRLNCVVCHYHPDNMG